MVCFVTSITGKGFLSVTMDIWRSVAGTIERAHLLHTGAVVESNCGSSSHYANPFMIMAEHNTTEDAGEAFGIALVYSGNHRMSARLNKYNVVNLSGGISPDNFRWKLKAEDSFCTPELVMSWSNLGLRLCGLSENALYIDKKNGQAYYGAQLMQKGLLLAADSDAKDYDTHMWELEIKDVVMQMKGGTNVLFSYC